jgi:hypothetical protein
MLAVSSTVVGGVESDEKAKFDEESVATLPKKLALSGGSDMAICRK